MAAPAGKVPILESVRAAFAAWRSDVRALVPFALVVGVIEGGLAFYGLTAGEAANGLILVLGLILRLLALSVFYVAAMRPMLGQARGERLVPAGMAVYAAMAIVGFFLFIVGIGYLLFGFAAIFATFSETQLAQLEAAQSDQQATLALLNEAFVSQPAPFILVGLLGAFILLALTSRLYVAAPATVASGRIRTFETWAWTKGNMLRIIAARLTLLLPASLAAVALGEALAAVTGPVSTAPAALTALRVGAATALAALIAVALEAQLSAYLHQGLRPPDDATAAPRVGRRAG